MLPVGIGSSGVDVGDIGHSLRFAASRSCYASRTFGTATNQYIFTWSGWVKLSGLDTTDYGELIECRSASSDAGYGSLYVYNGNIRFSGWATVWRTTTMELRDPSSWYHIVLAVDTTQATAANRIKLYVNGVEVTSFTTSNNPTQNTTVGVNTNSSAARIGSDDPLSSSRKLDGYTSRVCFVDGQALTPSSFGYQNTAINEWVSKTQSEVKAVVDAGGTNSFMLDFDNGSSTTTLGYDKSSKGNNWTLSGHSLTAGTNYDWGLDRPGCSYSTFNPLDVANVGTRTIQNGNVEVNTSSGAGGARLIAIPPTGKWSLENFYVSGTWSGNKGFGIVTRTGDISGGVIPTGCVTYNANGNKTSGGAYSAYGATYTSTNGIRMDVDQDAGTVTFYKDGVSQGAITHGLGTEIYACIVNPSASACVDLVSAGQAPFHSSAAYDSASLGYWKNAPSSGFKAPCQANMPEGSITTSGSFTGTLNADGPCVYLNGVPTAMTINGNAVTFGTNADALSNGFKVRSSSSSYNNTGSNTYSITSTGPKAKYSLARGNP